MRRAGWSAWRQLLRLTISLLFGAYLASFKGKRFDWLGIVQGRLIYCFGRNAFTSASFVVRYGPSIRSMQ